MARSPEYVGAFYTIESVTLANGSCPVGDFLDRLEVSDVARVEALFTRLGDHRTIHNKGKFRKLADTEIWEFKSHQIRILCCFTIDRKVVLLHALWKKQDKHKRSDLEIAEERRRWYLFNRT